MTRSIKIAVAAAIALSATSAFATNGDHMIGLSAESRALGGTGIANFMGSGNALTNPSLLAKTKTDNEFAFAGTMFKSDVDVTTTAGSIGNAGAGVSKESDEGMSVIPAISLSHRINDTTVFGLGMYGTAGMGTDWRGSAVTGATVSAEQMDLYNMRSSLMLMQFAPSIAYGTDIFGVGLTAIMQYGALSIDYDTANSLGQDKHVGSGTSNDFGYGFQVGAYYNPMKSLTIGATYKSAIDMEYKNQISDAGAAYGYGASAAGLAAKSDHLEQPEEYGVGVAFDMGAMTYTMDVKEIKWSDAKGYKDFGWDDQTVYALGVKYSADDFWLGAGFNYGENPIPNNTSTADVDGFAGGNTDGDTMNLFNYAMFPATTESHYTIGGGYTISKGMALALAYTYAPEVSDTVSATSVGVGDVTTKHSQQALTVALKFNY
jgi:long-chain fatty acid transport protein